MKSAALFDASLEHTTCKAMHVAASSVKSLDSNTDDIVILTNISNCRIPPPSFRPCSDRPHRVSAYYLYRVDQKANPYCFSTDSDTQCANKARFVLLSDVSMSMTQSTIQAHNILHY